jgi:2-dehydro-3-deoxygalactonokinase
VLADPYLGGLYAAAIEEAGGRAIAVDSHASFAAGILQIWKECA